jgi:hypothetical protein
MKYRFRATRAFWRSFEKLPAQQQSRARKTFAIFKQNPFDPRVRTVWQFDEGTIAPRLITAYPLENS